MRAKRINENVFKPKNVSDIIHNHIIERVYDDLREPLHQILKQLDEQKILFPNIKEVKKKFDEAADLLFAMVVEDIEVDNEQDEQEQFLNQQTLEE